MKINTPTINVNDILTSMQPNQDIEILRYLTLKSIFHVNRKQQPNAMSDMNEVLKSINNPVRRDILHWLKSPQEHFNLEKQLVDTDVEGVCVSIIQEKSGLSQSTVSSYLSNLQRAKLVTSKRIGSWTYYKRNDEYIEKFLKALSDSL